ncbi:hypothetical protein ACFORG_19390 [Lutimaribacter marinistellae]|uniref:Uncharacterized protein n=1 Tax=Lutimaribacter marinistellae TaxID=1820329 RepID=A0ABV7TJW4_9RHOB
MQLLPRLRLAFAAGLVMVGAAPAIADMPVTYRSDGRALFQVSAPDFWQVRAGGPRSLTPPGSDEARLINRIIGLSPVTESGAWIGFMSPNGVSTFAQAEDYLRNIGQSIVSDPEVTGQRDIRVGGLAARSFKGTGRRDGRGVNFTAVVIDLPGNRMAVSLAVLDSRADPALVNDLNAIYGSFRAIR